MNTAFRNSPLRRIAVTLTLVLTTLMSLQPLAVSAEAWGIDQLMTMLAEAKSGRATFVEQKHIAMLDRPVESSGELRYIAPDRLEKLTIKPKREAMLVQGNEMTIESGSKKYVLQLSDYPEAAGFIDSIRGTLAGDRKMLERSYALTLEGNVERWTLALSPIGSRMADVIQLIRVSGRRDDVRGIEILQTDGDRSVMKIKRATTQ